MSSRKMKGLFNGLRYISQIFDEEKEEEIQIGFPTDVKHVAHIGWDGGQPVDNPSWMKEFKGATAFQSQPLGLPENREEPEIKWVSEDTKRSNRAPKPSSPKNSDLPEVPKSSRRHASSSENNNGTDSPKKKDPSRPRHSRRNHSRDSSEGSVRRSKELSLGGESPARNLPDIPKKTRRKKSRDSNSVSGTSKPRTKHHSSDSRESQPTSLPSTIDEENNKDCRVNSKEN